MTQAIARLAPYVVMELEAFQLYAQTLMKFLGAPRDTDWQKEVTQVRESLERVNPTTLVRLLSTRGPSENVCFTFVVTIIALHVGFPLSPGFRNFVCASLDRQRNAHNYPFTSAPAVCAELDRLCQVLRQSAAVPAVQIVYDPPAWPPMEPEDA